MKLGEHVSHLAPNCFCSVSAFFTYKPAKIFNFVRLLESILNTQLCTSICLQVCSCSSVQQLVVRSLSLYLHLYIWLLSEQQVIEAPHVAQLTCTGFISTGLIPRLLGREWGYSTKVSTCCSVHHQQQLVTNEFSI